MTGPDLRPSVGRPEVTSRAAIEQAAFELFVDRGFDGTTMEAIAERVGVGRRTLFRYYASKNDIPWGQFDQTLENFRRILDDMPHDLPLREAVHLGVIAFNDFPQDAQPPHRDRMRLILETPTLQAHSVLRYAQWREVIAEYAAQRLGLSATDVLPATIAQVSLAIALTAYDQWLHNSQSDLLELLDEAMSALVAHVG